MGEICYIERVGWEILDLYSDYLLYSTVIEEPVSATLAKSVEPMRILNKGTIAAMAEGISSRNRRYFFSEILTAAKRMKKALRFRSQRLGVPVSEAWAKAF